MMILGGGSRGAGEIYYHYGIVMEVIIGKSARIKVL